MATTTFTPFPSLPSRLAHFTSLTPTKMLFEYVDDQGRTAQKCTYAWFDDKTRNLAKRLSRYRGQIVLLVYPPGTLDFIVAFVACLRAGVVAVPVYPPRPSRNKDLAMFIKVQSNCGAKIALTNTMYNWATKMVGIKDVLTNWMPFFGSSSSTDENQELKWPELEWIVTDKDVMGGGDDDKIVLDMASPQDTAFLQYTSGSTSDPKGVVLTHGNLAHNLSLIIHALKAKDDTIVVSWLPQYHDMGLIGSHLGALYCGGAATIMSPISFVKNPPMWLDLVSSRRGTHLQAPNFAYRLTVRKFMERSTQKKTTTSPPPPPLDLSSVRHVFNAAEPIDPTAIDEFIATFMPFGFKPEAMVPGYGLAEHTVYVCDGGKQRLCVDVKMLEEEDRVVVVAPDTLPPASPPGGSKPTPALRRVIVGCGFPNRDIPREFDVHVRIVHKDKRTKLDEDHVGEIWISSPSASVAYFGLKEKSQAELQAKLVATTSSLEEPTEIDPELDRIWIRTGDLGFLHEEELFVCGRIKDMLIIRGRNHFPQDIELSVERVDRARLRPGTCAAFSVRVDGEEKVVVAVEVREEGSRGGSSGEDAFKDLIVAIRASVAKEHGVGLYAVVLLPQHGSQKTTSGKISRHRSRKAFENDSYEKRPLVIWVSGETDLIVVEDGGGEDLQGGGGEQPQQPQSDLPPRTLLKGQELLDKLVAEAVMILEREQVDATVPLADLGFDSMALTQYKTAVLNSLGCDIPDEILFEETTTLDRIRRVIEDGTTGGGGGPEAVDFTSETSRKPHRRHINKPGQQEPTWKLCCKCLSCRLFT